MAYLRYNSIVLFLMLFLKTSELFSQAPTKLTLGIDFINYNRNWIQDPLFMLKPKDGKYYRFDYIPSLFIKITKGKHILRFKHEYEGRKYLFETGANTDIDEILRGYFKSNRFLLGFERTIVDRKIRLYLIIDYGITAYSFSGVDYQCGGIAGGCRIYDISVKGQGIDLQPGIGIEKLIFNNLYCSLESSLNIEKRFGPGDIHYMISGVRLTPRPISLFGISYKF